MNPYSNNMRLRSLSLLKIRRGLSGKDILNTMKTSFKKFKTQMQCLNMRLGTFPKFSNHKIGAISKLEIPSRRYYLFLGVQKFKSLKITFQLEPFKLKKELARLIYLQLSV